MFECQFVNLRESSQYYAISESLSLEADELLGSWR